MSTLGRSTGDPHGTDASRGLTAGRRGSIPRTSSRSSPVEYSLNVQEAVTALCPQSSCPRGRESVVDRVEFLLTNISTHYVKSACQEHRGVLRGTCSSMPSGRGKTVSRSSSGGFREPSQRGRFTSCTSCSRTHRSSSFHLDTATGQRRSRGSTTGAGTTTRGSCFRATSDTCSRSRTQTSSSGDLSAASKRRPLRPRASRGRGGSRCELPSRGQSTRVTGTNVGDIANVPLFVKYPNQDDGGTADSRAARTVDILPTIADVLGVHMPWRVHGTSLLSSPPRRREAAVGGTDGTTSFATGRGEATDAMRRCLARRRSSAEVATRSIESA